MAVGSSFAKILKGLGKNIDNATSHTVNTVGKGADIASSLNKNLFRDLTEKELDGDYSILQNLTKRKAKTSANWMAFGGLATFGALSSGVKEARVNQMGEIGAGQMYDMTSNFVSPTVENEVDAQKNDEEKFGKDVQDASKRYGSAGPDLVFALHELRNR